MKFPFFKASSAQTEPVAKPLVTPRPAVATAPPPARPEPPAPAAARVTEVVADVTVPLRLGSILSQLPPQLFNSNNRMELSAVTIAIPASLILPRLASGRVAITLSDLIPLLPTDSVRHPMVIAAKQQSIVLPLAEVIAAIPPEAFALQHDSTITTDTPEFDKLPKLFDDALLEEPDDVVPEPVEEPAAASSTPAADATTVPSPTLSDATPAGADETYAGVHPALVSDVPDHVKVSLRSLVSVMPDNVFCCPRADLWRKADFNLTVLLPTQPMLPQLTSARVRLPLAQVLEVVPPTLLVNPLPNIEDETVSVPLAEIIPQLPPRLFTEQLRQFDTEVLEVPETEVPVPFAERTPAAVSPEPESSDLAVEPPQPTEVSQPEQEPVFAEEQTDSEMADLDDANFEIFADKSALAAPSEVAATPEVAVTSEQETHAEPVFAEEVQPVAEAEPVAEVMAETQAEEPEEPEPQTVEPVAEEPQRPAEPAETLHTCASEISDFDEKRFLIDLNRCTVEDLQRIPRVGPSLARRIIEFRETRGKFNSIDELRQVPGIGRKTFRALAGIHPRTLNRLLGAPTDRELTLQEVVRLLSAVPGIAGCMLAMSDGLFLTGQLPSPLDQNTVSVFAPHVFRKLGRYMRELRVGQIRRITIFTDQYPLSVFRAGDVYLIVVHDTQHFSKALLRRCERISQEIGRYCQQRAVV